VIGWRVVLHEGLTAAAHDLPRTDATLDCTWAIPDSPIPFQTRPDASWMPRLSVLEMFDVFCSPDGRHARTVAPAPHEALGCCRFQRHLVKVEDETGGGSWEREGNSAESSSLKQLSSSGT
jgi:hypothetical protein